MARALLPRETVALLSRGEFVVVLAFYRTPGGAGAAHARPHRLGNRPGTAQPRRHPRAAFAPSQRSGTRSLPTIDSIAPRRNAVKSLRHLLIERQDLVRPEDRDLLRLLDRKGWQLTIQEPRTPDVLRSGGWRDPGKRSLATGGLFCVQQQSTNSVSLLSHVSQTPHSLSSCEVFSLTAPR